MVTRLKKIIEIVLASILLIFTIVNYGCSPANILATGGGSAMVVAEGERSLGTVREQSICRY